MKKIYLLSTLLTSILTISNAQKIQLTKLGEGTTATRQGIVYALPKTTIAVEVEIKKTEMFKKPKASLCDSGCLARTGLKEITKDTTFFKINNYTISSKASVDENQIYLINPKSKWNKKKDVSLTLSGLGIIQGAEITAEDKTFNIITKGISAAISTVGLFTASIETRSPLPDSRLIDLVQKKERLLGSGTYGADLTTIQYQVDELNKLIAKEIYALVGKTKVTTSTLRFELDLDTTDIKNLKNGKVIKKCLFKYHSNKGVWIFPEILKANNHILYPAKFMKGMGKGLDGSKGGKEICLEIVNRNFVLNQAVSTLGEPGTEKGLAYRIPEHVLCTITDSDTIPKLKSVLPIAQLGTIIHLPYKMDKASVTYYESMGSLKTVSVSSSGLNVDNFDTAKSIISDTKDLLDGESSVEKLMKEVEELELQVRKKAAEDQLSNPINNEG